MVTTLPRPRQAARKQPPAIPGQLFNAEDFALADIPAQDAWERISRIAVREEASDIHLSNQRDGAHVALRLDGRLWPQGVLPADYAQRLANHVKIAATLDVGEKRRPQDGHISLAIDGRSVDLRVSIFPGNHGEDLAIRVLDREAALLDIEDLGADDRQVREMLHMLEAPSGLILVTGATGAGKTTTLYALLRRLAQDGRKVLSIEDPVEFDVPEICQSQTNPRIGNDFAALIRSALRQDPNVLMIGEVRDADTADAVLRAANSGRLVLATSHALHSGAAVESLIALGANPYFVARALRGVVAQTLVRRLCPYCTVRIEETCDARLFEDLRPLIGPHERPALSMGRGCPHCRHTGYRGRVGLFEVLSADESVRELCARGAPAREIYRHAVSRNMVTIEDAGKLAALRGLTTVEELLQSVSEIWTGEDSHSGPRPPVH